MRSVETICHDIYREALRQSAQFSPRAIVLAHPEVVERMLDEEALVLADRAAGRQADPPTERGPTASSIDIASLSR